MAEQAGETCPKYTADPNQNWRMKNLAIRYGNTQPPRFELIEEASFTECPFNDNVDLSTLDDAALATCSNSEFEDGLSYLCIFDRSGTPTSEVVSQQIRLTDTNIVERAGLECTGIPQGCLEGDITSDCGGDCVVANDIFFDPNDCSEDCEFMIKQSDCDNSCGEACCQSIASAVFVKSPLDYEQNPFYSLLLYGDNIGPWRYYDQDSPRANIKRKTTTKDRLRIQG